MENEDKKVDLDKLNFDDNENNPTTKNTEMIEQNQDGNLTPISYSEESQQNAILYKKQSQIITILLFTFVLLILLIIIMINTGYLNFNFSKNIISSFENSQTKEKSTPIELNYTKTSNQNIDGIYMTDVSEVVENVMPSIVAITSKTLISSGHFGPNYFGRAQYSQGAGSGIIVSKSDTELLILTNNHVVEEADELSVQFINEKNYDATIKGTSSKKDVAIIAIKLADLDNETLDTIKLATIGDSNSLKVGNGIIAIGNALGYGQSVTTGVVSALNRKVTIDNNTNNMIQIDAAINGGNSGGALLNSKGEVVGINSAKYSSSGSSSSASVEGMGFAIPISDILELITSLMNGEEDVSPTIGVEGYMIDTQTSKIYNLPIGFYISNIKSQSGADKSELEIGYIITAIDNKEIKNYSDLSNTLYNKKIGDVVILTVKYASGKNYKEKEVKVTLS